MSSLNDGGLTLKFMSMLAGVNHSSISRFASETSKTQKESQRRNFRYPFLETRRLLTKYLAEKIHIDANKKIHAFYNFKGGTGKTSLCYQVATHLVFCGYKVLLIDADPQSHLTISLGVTDNFDVPTLYDAVVNNMSLKNIAISLCEGLDLIPCNLSLTNIEVRLNEMLKKEEVLKRYIDPIKDSYDFIIFDCNPSISSLNRNILNVCNVLDIVCETYPYSMLGMKILFEDLDRFYSVMGIKKPEIIIIPNKYEDRSSLSGEAIAILHKYYSDYVKADFAIRKSEDFPRSARERLPISYFCKSNSNAFEDITDLIHLVLEKSKVSNSRA